VPDVLRLLASMRKGSSVGATAYLETPSVEWILRRGAVWDLFYEHCSYFSARTLTAALGLSGFRVDSVARTFGGQYLWAEAEPATGTRPAEPDPEAHALVQAFGEMEQTLTKALSANLDALEGPIALWGAGAKGVSLANLLDPGADRIACVVDLNPHKQGCYLPGTGHPIVDHRRLRDLTVRTVINMNSNYYAENRELLERDRIDCAVIDLPRLLAA
jgi:hypothetical protein